MSEFRNAENRNCKQFYVLSFYVFEDLEDCELWRAKLQELCSSLGLKGTVLLANEGANGSLSGQRSAVTKVAGFLRSCWGDRGLKCNCCECERPPFQRLCVKIKDEIVTLRHGAVSTCSNTGVMVEPQNWNQVLEDANYQIVDVRNTYETKVGSFMRAMKLPMEKFSQFPRLAEEHLDPERPIAMYCTGGIRCEKASSYLLARGFKQIYQLKGGILNYLKQVPEDQRLWNDCCFVFDERQTIDQQTNFISVDDC